LTKIVVKRKKLQHKISGNQLKTSYYINSEYLGSWKKLQKLALLITPEDKSNKPPSWSFFSLANKTSPQIWF